MAILNVAFQLLVIQSIIFLGMVAANSGFENQCNPSKIFYAARNRALRQFVYTTKTLCLRVLCGRECSMDERCKSFNFHEDTKTCEMSSTTRSQHSEDFSETRGSVYFDADEDTPFFSLGDNFFDSYTTQGSVYFDSEEHTTENLYQNKTCKTLLDAGFHSSGLYTIYPDGSNGLLVYCDMETEGGGWIVFQRRQDGSVDFYRVWDEYKAGFGDLSGEFWLGNDNLASLTSAPQTEWELRVDLDDWEGSSAWAKYTYLSTAKENQGYTMSIGQYVFGSTAGDSLRVHRGMAFSTKDRDNDMWFTGNCARDHQGAWWYNNCLDSGLNGLYYQSSAVQGGQGIFWIGWKGAHYSLKRCSMKIREINA